MTHFTSPAADCTGGVQPCDIVVNGTVTQTVGTIGGNAGTSMLISGTGSVTVGTTLTIPAAFTLASGGTLTDNGAITLGSAAGTGRSARRRRQRSLRQDIGP